MSLNAKRATLTVAIFVSGAALAAGRSVPGNDDFPAQTATDEEFISIYNQLGWYLLLVLVTSAIVPQIVKGRNGAVAVAGWTLWVAANFAAGMNAGAVWAGWPDGRRSTWMLVVFAAFCTILGAFVNAIGLVVGDLIGELFEKFWEPSKPGELLLLYP